MLKRFDQQNRCENNTLGTESREILLYFLIDKIVYECVRTYKAVAYRPHVVKVTWCLRRHYRPGPLHVSGNSMRDLGRQ